MFSNKLISRVFPTWLNLTLLTLLLGSALPATPAYAAGSIVVNSNTDDTLINLNANATCDLREAIINANANNQSGSTDCAAGNGTDTITFAADYTITLGSQLPAVTGTIVINGNGAAKTIIQASDCNPITLLNSSNSACTAVPYRVFEVGTSGNLTFDSLTVRNGNCNGSCATYAQGGGGIYNKGILAVKNSLFSANKAGDAGAGLFNDGSIVTINASTFFDNSSSNAGGAIYNGSGTMTISNSTIANNSATGNTGGGLGNSGTLNIYNSTVSFNTSASLNWDGDNIYNSGTLNLYNTIVSGSSFHGDCFNNGGTVNSTNSLVESTGTQACGLVNGSNGNIIGSVANLGVITGSPAYYLLQADSPAINAGDNAICAAAPVSNTSQNGVTRPQGGHCEIGSYELDPLMHKLFLPLILR